MDFAFPATATTTAAASTMPQLLPPSGPPPPACRHLPLFPRFATAPPLRRFAPAAAAAADDDDAAALAAEATRRRSTAVMAEEDHQPPPPPPPEKAGGDDAAQEAAAAAAELEDRMDMLWEDFNEELSSLAARRRRKPRPRVGGGSWRERGLEGPLWSEELSPASDAESEPAAAHAGCGPVLRPSARAAGGARHCRRRAGRWVLLMRIFRRLFVVEKTISAAAAAGASQRSTTRAR